MRSIHLFSVNGQSIWSASLDLEIHVFNPGRDSFSFEVETYQSWVWLALERGRFWFRLGSGRAAVEGECGGGDWVLCPPGEPLQRRMLTPCDFHHARFSAPEPAFVALRGKGTLRDSRQLQANFMALHEQAEDHLTKGWKGHLLLDILRRAAWEREHLPRLTGHDAVMEQARGAMEQNFQGAVSITQLACNARLSPATFSKRFSAAFGASPQEFLLRQRLNHARTLLLETDLTIDTVARQSGFSSGFYLSRMWTKRNGISPSGFRQLHRI